MPHKRRTRRFHRYACDPYEKRSRQRMSTNISAIGATDNNMPVRDVVTATSQEASDSASPSATE